MYSYCLRCWFDRFRLNWSIVLCVGLSVLHCGFDWFDQPGSGLTELGNTSLSFTHTWWPWRRSSCCLLFLVFVTFHRLPSNRGLWESVWARNIASDCFQGCASFHQSLLLQPVSDIQLIANTATSGSTNSVAVSSDQVLPQPSGSGAAHRTFQWDDFSTS